MMLASSKKGRHPTMSGSASGHIFISYRRQESSGVAGRLYDRLVVRFGSDPVFMDVDTIAPGVDFAEVIVQAVSACDVLLAVIGPRWLTAPDEEGRRRLDDPDDLVRLEIAAALERSIRVIPILIEDAVMPRPQQLPEDLAKLARCNAFSLRHERFGADADRLLAAIELILRAAVTPTEAPRPLTPVDHLADTTAEIPQVVQPQREPSPVDKEAASRSRARLPERRTEERVGQWIESQPKQDPGRQTVVKMPLLGEGLTEGTITRWLKQEGDRVELDEPLFEISTDKVDTEVPSPAGGVLSRIVVQVDETVEVATTLAWIAASY